MNGNMYFCVLFFLHFLLWHDINQKIARSVCPVFLLVLFIFFPVEFQSNSYIYVRIVS